jgi:hypothetical protein
MRYFYVEPEVAGGLGNNTVMDSSRHPPIVSRLHYQIDGWAGDAILESFPIFIVTEGAKESLLQIGATGAAFADVEVTVSDKFEDLQPGQKFPVFAWLKPSGKAGQDDIGATVGGRLVLSQRALDALSRLGTSNARIEAFGIDAADH